MFNTDTNLFPPWNIFHLRLAPSGVQNLGTLRTKMSNLRDPDEAAGGHSTFALGKLAVNHRKIK